MTLQKQIAIIFSLIFSLGMLGYSSPTKSETVNSEHRGAFVPPVLPGAVAPGKYFDFTAWKLQLPIGAPKKPVTIGREELSGPDGFHDSYFYADPNEKTMVFLAPENGVTTTNSRYPRSELRELDAATGNNANWQINGVTKTHILSATLKVMQVPRHTCIGQIHVGSPLSASVSESTKPLLELYYHSNGDIRLGIEKSPYGGQISHYIANVPLGEKFSYEIKLTGADNKITIVLDGKSSVYEIPSGFAEHGQYFKAGNYIQSASSRSTNYALVAFYALTVSHD